MPIVIVKGSDKNNSKTLNESNSEKSLYDSENPTNLPVSPSKKSSNSHSGNVNTNEKANGKIQSAIVSDMTDILDFKVYHITRPSFNEPVSKTILLGGELFYNKEEINKAIHTVDEVVEVADESTAAPPNNKPSVLQKIRQMKYASKQINNVQRNQKDILMHVKAASDRTKLIKSGHSLPAHLNPPTADETLEWAIRHVNAHEVNLVEMLIEFEAGMKDFEKQKEREKAAVLNKTLQLAMHAAGGGKNCAEGNEVTAMSTVAATSMSNKMNSSASNNNSSSTSASKAASAPSLSTLLDNLKSSGTEAFLSNITVIPARTTVTEPSAIGRKNSKQGGVAFNLKPNGDSSNQQHSLSTINEPGNGRLQPQLPHSAIPPGRKGGAANNHSHRVVRGSSHTTSATHSTTTHGHSTHNESHSEESEVQRFSRPTTAEESSAPGSHSPVNHFNRGRARTRTSSNADTVVTSATGDEGEDEDEVRPSESTVPRPPPRDKKKPANKSQSSNKTYSGAAHHRTYSNAQLDSSAQQHSDINQMNSHTKDTISEMKRTQQLFDQAMGYTLDIFNQAAEKTKKMQNTIEAKLRRGNRGGQRIVKQWKAFRDINVQQRESANELCEDKEFFRALDMAENLSCFEMDGYDKASGNHKLGVNAAKDLQIMRKNAQINSFNKVMNRLTATKWYCAIVSKFREYMKRMNNNVPVCCLKFLVIFRYILSYDFPLSKELFYKVVESTVVVKEDFIRSIVHVVLRAARDALKISPQEFLAYLESRNIQPCPELLNQIRTLTQVASASGSQNQSRSSSPRSSPISSPRGGVSSANGAMMCFDGLEMSLDMPVVEVLSLPADDAFSVPSSPRNFVLDMSKLTRKSVMIAEDSDQQSGAQSLLPAILNSTVV